MDNKTRNGYAPAAALVQDEMVVAMSDIRSMPQPLRHEAEELILDLTAMGTGNRENRFITAIRNGDQR